jgi:hypothetical protein
MPKKLTTEEFIRKARKVHGDKYDYPNVDYKNSQTKVKIICPKHGEFLQKPNNHLNGARCPICKGKIKLTTETFIKKARETHGNKYDYSFVKYKDAHAKVKIICPDHGEYLQKPIDHYRGAKCPACSGVTSLTTEDFIAKAIAVHGNKYDYSKARCAGNHKKVEIICPKHGPFFQTPSKHLSGQSCRDCAYEKVTKLNIKGIEQFIQEAKKIHGDKYNYEKVNYKGRKYNVEIICPEHGSFYQSPNTHLATIYGCPECSKIGIAKSNTKSTEQFIQEARKVHGDRYDYSETEYALGSKKVIIKCRIHGSFLQDPRNHIFSKSGCPECSKILIAQKQTKTTDQFIKEAIEIHGNKYDYSEVEYVLGSKKVKIICRIHGAFKQKPDIHIFGKAGCPKCAASKGEDKIRKVLDSFMIEYAEQYKFPDLKLKRKLPFDFYLPSLNLAIEYHGGQHYKYVPLYHRNKAGYERAMLRDKLKAEYCKNNGIGLIIIPFTEVDRVEEILTKELQPYLNLR